MKLYFVTLILTSQLNAACTNSTINQSIVQYVGDCTPKLPAELKQEEQKIFDRLKGLPITERKKIHTLINNYPLPADIWVRVPTVRKISKNHVEAFFNSGKMDLTQNDEKILHPTMSKITLSPSNKTMAYVEDDKKIRCLNTTTYTSIGLPILLRRKQKDIELLLLSDSKLLLYFPQTNAYEIWNLKERSRTNVTSQFPIKCITYNPKSKRCIISTYSQHEGDPIPCIDFMSRSLKKPTIKATMCHDKPITALAVHDNSSLVASASDKQVKIYNSNKPRMIALLAHPEKVRSIAFNSDGSKLATGTANDGGKIYLWSIPKKTPLATINLLSEETHAPPVFLSWNSKSLIVQTLWKELLIFKMPEQSLKRLIHLQKKERNEKL
jgi:hypothetical protein